MAERAIHSRKRYRTARKPNLSATATGSRAKGLLLLEADGRRAELDGVAGLERLGALDAAPVDLDAVGRAEVLDDPGPAAGPHLGVAAGHVLVGEHDVALPRAADHAAAGAQHRGLALVAQLGRPAPVVGLAQRLGEPLGGRVDHRVALVALAGRLRLVLGGADEPGLDAELTEAQPVVGAEADLRCGHERDPLAT